MFFLITSAAEKTKHIFIGYAWPITFLLSFWYSFTPLKLDLSTWDAAFMKHSYLLFMSDAANIVEHKL